MAVGLVTGILYAFGTHVNLTTVALAFLLVVLASATFFGRNPALVASFAAMLSFNFLFVPPLFTWHIADPQNLIAWAAFTITAIIAGELSSYARRRAREAERLYEELQTAFQSATEAEALRQSEKLKSALLDAVTHDLRTPLTSIKASVTTLLDSEGGHRTIELSSEGRGEFLSIINEETDRLNSFIEGIVQLARAEANVGNQGARPANVEEIIGMTLERAETVVAVHHVVVNIERELPLVNVEARAIAEALYNLIENAAKYSPPGSTITVTAATTTDVVAISVEDEGKGIPVEMREKVFDKFVRIEGSQTDGLGLGLAIVRGIIEAQNGTIVIGDGQNGGTRVTITVPVA
jgi:two-component system sensor histidine kinase KdpD